MSARATAAVDEPCRRTTMAVLLWPSSSSESESDEDHTEETGDAGDSELALSRSARQDPLLASRFWV